MSDATTTERAPDEAKDETAAWPVVERTWHHKAHDVIAKHAKAAWEAANLLPNGRMRKKHVPYHIPALADALVRALGKDDEAEAKRLFEVDRLGAWSLV